MTGLVDMPQCNPPLPPSNGTYHDQLIYEYLKKLCEKNDTQDQMIASLKADLSSLSALKTQVDAHSHDEIYLKLEQIQAAILLLESTDQSLSDDIKTLRDEFEAFKQHAHPDIENALANLQGSFETFKDTTHQALSDEVEQAKQAIEVLKDHTHEVMQGDQLDIYYGTQGMTQSGSYQEAYTEYYYESVPTLTPYWSWWCWCLRYSISYVSIRRSRTAYRTKYYYNIVIPFPTGKTQADLIAFIPSIRRMYLPYFQQYLKNTLLNAYRIDNNQFVFDFGINATSSAIAEVQYLSIWRKTNE